jgi:hypothetical protein
MTYNTVTGNLSNTSSGGALGGSASGTATTVSPTATSVAVGGGGGGGGAPPKTVAATVSIDGSSMVTSAKFAAAHGLRGLNLATKEGRDEALIILSISMATTGGQSSSLASSLTAMNSVLADSAAALSSQNSSLTNASARATVQDIVKDAGALLLATDLDNRNRLVSIVESTS